MSKPLKIDVFAPTGQSDPKLQAEGVAPLTYINHKTHNSMKVVCDF